MAKKRLKPFLRGAISSSISALRESIAQRRGSLRYLQKADLGDADYVVNLRSLWENEGGKSVSSGHRGNLVDAIKKAEELFKSQNKGGLQADYSVMLRLGSVTYSIPSEFWKEYTERGRQSI